MNDWYASKIELTMSHRLAAAKAIAPRVKRADKKTKRHGSAGRCSVPRPGKWAPPMMGDLVPRLRRFVELTIADRTATALMAMSVATLDRRLAGDRARLVLKGRSHTKPGSMFKVQIPTRICSQWDDAVPGFVEIDRFGHV